MGVPGDLAIGKPLCSRIDSFFDRGFMASLSLGNDALGHTFRYGSPLNKMR